MEDLREEKGQFIECPRTSGGPRTPNPSGLVGEEDSYRESSSQFFFSLGFWAGLKAHGLDITFYPL